MNAAAALFDIDGTLVDTRGAGRRAFERALEKWLGRPAVSRGFDFSGRTDLEILRTLAALSGAEHPEENRVREILDDYLALLEDELANGPAGGACPGVEPLLGRLAVDPRWTLGIVTGNLAGGGAAKLRRYGLDRYFPRHGGRLLGAFGDDEEDRRLLVPVALRRIAEATGRSLPPHRAVVIGDTPRDVACARAAGSPVLAVSTGFCPASDLEACEPDRLLADLSDTAGVLAILERMAGLEPSQEEEPGR